MHLQSGVSFQSNVKRELKRKRGTAGESDRIGQVGVGRHIHGCRQRHVAGLKVEEDVVGVLEGTAGVPTVPEGHLCPCMDAGCRDILQRELQETHGTDQEEWCVRNNEGLCLLCISKTDGT